MHAVEIVHGKFSMSLLSRSFLSLSSSMCFYYTGLLYKKTKYLRLPVDKKWVRAIEQMQLLQWLIIDAEKRTEHLSGAYIIGMEMG